MSGQILVNLGFGNYVLAGRVVAVVNPASSPMRRLREDAKSEGRLIDASQGRKTRSILVTDSNHVILSAVSAETISQRFLAQQYSDEVSTTAREAEDEHN